MIQEEWMRSRILFGEEGMRRLQQAKVAIFGIGGVGSYAAEALARSGIFHIDLIDSDTVAKSNINRQLVATVETIGRLKVQVMKERILSINPDAKVATFPCFYLPENAGDIDLSVYTYILDAVDTIAAKIKLAVEAKRNNVSLISCMGAGNKLDPTKFEVADLYETSVCPLAKVMRKELRACGIDSLKVVYSREVPVTKKSEIQENLPEGSKRRSIPGSVSFVPSVAGLIMAGEVVKDIIKGTNKRERESLQWE